MAQAPAASFPDPGRYQAIIMLLADPLRRWIDAEQGRFALWLPVAALCGDAAFFALRAPPPSWPVLALLALGAAAAAARRLRVLHAAGLLLLLFAAGWAAAQFAAWRAPPWVLLPRRAAHLVGRVALAEPLPNGIRLTLDRITLDGHLIGPRRLRITADADAAAAPGAQLALRAMLSPPAPPAYPGGRDLQRDAWFTALGGYGYTLGAVTLLRPAPPARWAGLRQNVAARLQAGLPGPRGAIAATLLTGRSAAIPTADRAAFRDSGLSHLLAIAGLHVGIVMGLVLGATRWLLLRSERIALRAPVRQIAAATALAAGMLYLAITGTHVPTLRSVAMAALAVLALLSGRRAVSLRNWGLAALLVIAVAPEDITGASFQLSFAAVLALIAGYESLRGPLQRLRGAGGLPRRLAHHLCLLALTSLLAGTASLPFIAYHFGRVQLYFILANLIAVALTALWIMPAGLLALALMPVGLERLALVPMGWGIGAVLRLAHAVASWPGATIAVPHLPLPALLTMAAGLAWLCLWRSQLRWIGLAALPAAIALAWLTPPPDLLIAPDARLVGLRTRTALYVQPRRGGDAYVQASWEQYLGRPAQALATAPDARCTDAGCRLLMAGTAVRLAGVQAPCDAAVMVALSGAPPYCPGTVAIGRDLTWRDGSVAVWLAQPRVLTDRADRGTRPWVWLPPEQERARIALPFARTE